MKKNDFIAHALAKKIVDWQKQYGRHDLPWQGISDPYRVWLSEVMLQQTQVATVIPYFEAFVQKWPNVEALAQAPLKEVLSQWAGLGYYSRAKHLHQCAQGVMRDYGGVFPTTAQDWVKLPGVGLSTAAAISAFCYGQRVVLLDGNVQRLLSRVWAYEENLASVSAQKELREKAQSLSQHMTKKEMPVLTQGLMDLGALVCKRRRPDCVNCPLLADCQAYQHNKVEQLPYQLKKLKRKTMEGYVCFAFRQEDGALWVQRRPLSGIWSGLEVPLMVENKKQTQAWKSFFGVKRLEYGQSWTHVLTHRDWVLTPVIIKNAQTPFFENEQNIENGYWLPRLDWPEKAAFPAPIRQWLLQFAMTNFGDPL